MKVLIFAFIMFFTGLSSQNHHPMKHPAFDKLKTSCDAKDEDIKAMFEALHSQNNTPPEKIQCLTKCWLQVQNRTSSDGTLTLEPLKKRIMEAVSNLDKCNAITKKSNKKVVENRLVRLVYKTNDRNVTIVVNMKVSVLFLVCFLQLSLQDSVREALIKANTHACIAEGNLDQSVVKHSFKSGFTNDTSVKCFYKCFLNKENSMSLIGELTLMPIKEKFLKAAEMVDACGALTAPDACELAYSATKCLRNVFQTLL
ncbi:hypothetical protein FQR65_LT14265 [Abscondita terminalis]|nr:hypothetical protein FQR65_LT14265 [Abscondita terminalis]